MAKRSASFSSKSNRFNFDFDDDDFQERKKGFVPENTDMDTKKCIRLFEEWARQRSDRYPNEPVPANILEGKDRASLCNWLCKFSAEIRKVDDTNFPPKSIQHYLVGVQRFVRTKDDCEKLNIFTDGDFLPLRKLLDALYRKLHSQGIGCSSKQTEVMMDEDEEKLWNTGVLDPGTPQGLLNCVFILNGKNFCLRGGAEHRDLKISQLQREYAKFQGKPLVRYTYTEFVSKNRSGGLKQIRQSNKVVHQYESENEDRCHVLLLDKYLSKLPPGAKENDVFYLKPKQCTPTDPLKPWYNLVPVGRNVLGQMVKNMFKEAKIEKSVTNHSLRAYGVSKMFAANVPEKIIMERSGHRSLEGVRQYEWTNTLQELQVCQVLDSKPKPNK